ncbi:helix-turn-helix domain-containing protein [Pseudarthrobacter psychrotolerans]|uniref:Helix-turn-helix domain-containing protein n=1 Tax=Pseudarthrobacter psychrotolerans TaxID=2697569 RepID=A0A6P1NMU6_9MICC|nr:helix-turn-helix transcriptional regulator [Pseudarthrobacter psychrotolerans]QHK19854.1 helix-turn-helix domain-containing protein [Pseudarthrobacter psychrotolerans]
MQDHDIQQLAGAIRERRQELGLSASEVARRADVAKGTITRLELGQITSPRMDNLRSIADVLQIPLTNLLAESRVLRGSDLPTLQPYLRTKFKEMPEGAVREIEAHFRDVAARHGININTGPAPGEDE